MQIYDILMLAILAFATWRGYRKGLVWQIAWIASIGISYYVAYRFRDQVALHIALDDPWRTLVAMLVLYIATSLVIWFIFQNVNKVIENAKLKDFDQQLGAILGLVKGAALCVVITLFAVSLLQPDMTQYIVNSHSAGYVARVLDKSQPFMPHQLQQIVAPYLKKAEDRLNKELSRTPGGLLGNWLRQWTVAVVDLQRQRRQGRRVDTPSASSPNGIGVPTASQRLVLALSPDQLTLHRLIPNVPIIIPQVVQRQCPVIPIVEVHLPLPGQIPHQIVRRLAHRGMIRRCPQQQSA